MKTIKYYLPVLLFSTCLLAQNYLPDSRKGDWEGAGSLKFIRASLSIAQTNNVLDYGANNTGQTGNSNHIAIASAIADRSMEGVTLIYFPAGEYIIESAVGINGFDNLILAGDGSEATRLIFNFNTADQTCFYIANSNRIGFENFYIERLGSYTEGRYFSIHSDSTWLSGVESNRAPTDHITITSNNVEIRGCYFHHCQTYGTGGQGYGIVLGMGASHCLIENNVFNHFRHSVIMSNGPHDNVVGYNYSLDPYTTETYLGISDWPSDMCLHGHPDPNLDGPSRNLFEGNICAFMHADDAWGDNGPYNTYFRSRATYYGLKIYSASPNQNVIANEVDDADGSLADNWWNAFNIQSTGNYVVGNINFDPTPAVYPAEDDYSGDYSLYLDPDNLPDFLSSVAYFPPIGAVDASHLGGGSIPAKDRWDAGGVITVMESHPSGGAVVIADLTLQEDDPATLHDDLRTAFRDDFPGGELTFSITSNSNPLLVSVTINSDSTLVVTPAADANGSATVVVTADHSGGGSATDEFIITVQPVNDPPSFTAGADQDVDEDCGEVTVSGWASAISAGPADESGQTVTFTVGTDNDDLFALLPSIDATGVLSFTPADNANGSATVTVVLSDDGGTANGGDDSSDPQTFTVTVQPVNDPPSFTMGPDQDVDENCGAVTVTGWATAISAGPADETDAGLVFTVTTDNDALFDQLPSVSAAGDLSFTPATDMSGSAIVTVVLSDGEDETAPQTFSIVVNPVIEPPSFTIGADQDVDEDCGTITVSGWATAISPGSSEVSALAFTVTTDNDALFEELPTVSIAGDLSFTPAPDANGSATVTVVLSDGDLSTVPQTSTITVLPVNDPPSFTIGADRDVDEDCGPVTVSGWATAVSAGPADESGQTVTFTVSTDNDDLFALLPSIDATGVLSFTPADNTNGSATVTVVLSDDGGTANGGDDSADPQTFTVTVQPVNDPPSFTMGVDRSVEENCGPVTVTGWATGISAGPSDESDAGLAFTVTTDNDALFDQLPSVSAAGDLSFTPATDMSGSAIVTVVLSDGEDETAARTFSIVVNPVIEPPSFTIGADQDVDEDCGNITVSGWATDISPGSSEVSALAFTVTTDNDALFDQLPTVSITGDLTFTPALDANGSATVSVVLSDGDLSTVPQTFTITVEPINDPPSFTVGADQDVEEDCGPVTVSGWATAISAGPADESGQTVTFTVSTDNNDLFALLPSIDATGVLSFTPADNANGSATVTVVLSDDGGTANGGDDSSDPQTFTVTVEPVNDPPSFSMGVDRSVEENCGPVTVTDWATDISAGPADETDVGLVFTVTTDNDALFDQLPSVSAAGDLSFTPATDMSGSAIVTVVLSDGEDETAAQTFSIVVNPVIEPPSFTIGADQDVDEDCGTITVSGWATDISPGSSEVSALAFTVTTDNDALFDQLPTVSITGDLTFTPALDANGSATVSVVLSDGELSTAPQTFTITVEPVNDPPSFTIGADQDVDEDCGTITVSGWATDISSGSSEVSDLAFTVTTENDALFDQLPTVSIVGDLAFTPASDGNGSATVTVVLSDGDLSTAPQTFTITVEPVNDPPSFIVGADQDVEEDCGAVTVSGWATAISAGPADESGQTVTFTVSTDNDDLFALLPSIDATGVLSFTPADNTNGSATVTVVLSDDGGTANGGDDSADPQTFTVTVQPVNDPPSFTMGADRSVEENYGPVTVTGWATGISAGPSDESDAGLAFTVTTDNDALFDQLPSVSAAGDLSFTPATDMSGSAIVTVVLSDGEDETAAQTFSIVVNPVIEPPSFTIGADQDVDEDCGNVTVSGWATDITPGSSEVSALAFTVTTDNDALFEELPTVSIAGDLSFTPAPDANGSATVTVVLSDGDLSTVPQTSTITVEPVNDPPSFTVGADQGVEEDCGPVTVSDWATGISAGPADESDVGLDFTVTTDNDALFNQLPTINITGDLTFTPAPDANGSATVSVVLSDGELTTDPQTFAIMVNPVNDPPEITSSAVTDARAGESYSYTVTAGDVDGDDLTFTLVDKPDGMAVNGSTGEITWNTDNGDAGSHDVTVKVEDAGGASDEQQFTIFVEAPVRVWNTLTSGEHKQLILPQELFVAPNPVRSTDTKVGFSVAGKGNVTGELLIYDVVANLLCKKMVKVTLTGEMTIIGEWDLRNRYGRKVAPGTYLAVVKIVSSSGRGMRILRKKIGVSTGVR